MADDGMLLNFAVPDEPWQAKQTFKGGRWKDRLTAKKAAAYHQNKGTGAATAPPKDRATGANSEGVHRERRFLHDSTDFSGPPRPAKRQRVEGDYRPSNDRRTGERNAGAAGEWRDAGKPPPPKQVISSLFTYNPSSTTQPAADAEPVPEDETPVAPTNAPLSPELHKFTSLGLSPSVAQHLLNKMQIKAPTSIQSKAVEQLVKEDSDAFIQAETGSGKTLAYLLPIVQRLINMSESLKQENGVGLKRDSGLFAIILAPTRELSKQISNVLEALLGCAHWIVAGTVIGGESKKSEKARVRKGLNILVATPGRLADHFQHTEALDVSTVRWLVLDEGDRLMELGFEQDIQKIVSVLNLRMRKVQTHDIPGLPEKRTTVLCSATIKNDVNRLGSITLKDAVSIAAERAENDEQDGRTEGAFSAPAQLKQSYAVVPAKLRLVTLIAILRRAFARRGSVMKTILFMSCADSVDFHFEVLARKGEGETATEEPQPAPAPAAKPPSVRPRPKTLQPPNKIRQGGTIDDARTSAPSPAISGKDNQVMVFRLHGSLPQAVRTSTLKAFTSCTEPAVLVCTDVAARGLDLPNVDFVIEYDPPFSKDDHLHRIGRTARAGREGRALIFLQPGNEEGYVDILKDGRHDNGRGLTRHDAEDLIKKGFASATGAANANNREYEDLATDWQLDVERWALESPKHLEQARRAYQSHIRAYATHVAAERGYFNMKTLHLGHLAKAFALRDKPGTINVPGLRPDKDTAEKTKESRKAKAKGIKSASVFDGEDVQVNDEREARKKMRIKMRAMGGASEFNLG